MTSQGHQVFVVSWRNPGPQHGDWRLENYCEALVDAIGAVTEITRSPKVNTFGFCAGGITVSFPCSPTWCTRGRAVKSTPSAMR